MSGTHPLHVLIDADLMEKYEAVLSRMGLSKRESITNLIVSFVEEEGAPPPKRRRIIRVEKGRPNDAA